MARHVRFVARTVIVNLKEASTETKSPWETAFGRLNQQLNREDIIQTCKRNRYYEKKWMRRRRLAYAECREIYGAAMQEKLKFVLRHNRREPWRVD